MGRGRSRTPALGHTKNLMPVRVGVTDVPPTSVGVTFGLFVALFTLLLAAELCIMFRQIERGPDGPKRIESWIRSFSCNTTGGF